MKKLIQFVSFLALSVVIGVVSANAQSTNTIDAKIPFDFSVGGKIFTSGTYEIKIHRNPNGHAVASLRDSDGYSYSILVSRNGEVSVDESKLLFTTIQDQRYLSQIIMPDGGFSIVRTNVERRLTQKDRKGRSQRAAL